ncbi:hypothetical protein PFISCL1PPCAC_14877, partial [Pristionchus fissidentatus]
KNRGAIGKKRKGKKKDDEEIPSKKKLNSDDDIEILEEGIDPTIESKVDDRPSTSRDTVDRRDTVERKGVPQFVMDIIQKGSNARAATVPEQLSSSMIYQEEGDKRAATMRELMTLHRILSRGRYEEISEGEADMAIHNTSTEERREVHEEDSNESSSSENEWEEMELADPEGEDEGNNKNIEVRVKGSAAKGKVDWKTKWLRTEVNRSVRENRNDVEKVMFLSLLAHCRYLTRCALDEQLLPSVMLTLIPSGYQSLVGHSVDEKNLIKSIKWFKDAFRPSRETTVATPTNGYRFGMTARLEKLAERKEYEDSTDAALLLFALFHSFEWTTRLVKNFNLRFPWQKKEGKKRGGKRREEGEGIAWVEVWMINEKKWNSIDPISGMIMKDDIVEETLNQSIQYVIAVDNKFGIREVAFRFASGFSTPKFRRRRRIEEWIKEVMAIQTFRSDGSRTRAEDYEYHCRIEDREVPTTIQELKQHPLYVMEKDLKKYEAIYPKDTQPVSVVRKERVFLRSNVYHLQGSINWVKFGREIKEGEIPYKIVSKRAKTVGGPCDSLSLYGYWQTAPYKVPKIVDGKIPHNEFGNIYMYRPEMCPEGAVHLQYPGMVSMSRRLDLQAIPAVIGWQCQGGRNVPILDGAVVLKKDVRAFKEEMKKRVKEEEEKELKKRENRVWGNWRRLIRGAMRLKNLNDRFGKKEEDHV